MIANLIKRYKIARDKARTLRQLSALSPAQLRDIGLDPYLIDMGIQGWPWKDQPQQRYGMLNTTINSVSVRYLKPENDAVQMGVKTAA